MSAPVTGPTPTVLPHIPEATPSLLDSLLDTVNEINRQNRKWGEQNHPDGTGPETQPLGDFEYRKAFFGHRALATSPARSLAAMATEVTDVAAAQGHVTWADILFEEVFEALAEDDLVRLRAELHQVAGVAIQWAAAVGRRLDDDVNADRAGRGTDR